MGFVAFVICFAFCASRVWKARPHAEPAPQDSAAAIPHPAIEPSPPTARTTLVTRWLWLLLPACASILLLAITNKICQDVAVIPFLWVLPLALYLLSFIICFDSPRWYVRGPFALALIAALIATCWVLPKKLGASIYFYSAELFICCMVCHGELYRLRPEPRQLTSFYLLIAAGGRAVGLHRLLRIALRIGRLRAAVPGGLDA
jgi:hypothetical protein